MQRDRGDRAERGGPWLNSGWDPSAEVTRDRDDLGVVGMPAAGTRDQVTDFEPGGSWPYLNHASCRAVTNRRLLGQLPLHRAQRLRDPLATSSVDHLSHEVGARARLPHERFLGQLDRRPLGARADHRVEIADENSSRRAGRVGHLAYDGVAGPRLEHLFQAGPPAGLRFVPIQAAIELEQLRLFGLPVVKLSCQAKSLRSSAGELILIGQDPFDRRSDTRRILGIEHLADRWISLLCDVTYLREVACHDRQTRHQVLVQLVRIAQRVVQPDGPDGHQSDRRSCCRPNQFVERSRRQEMYARGHAELRRTNDEPARCHGPCQSPRSRDAH